MDFIETVDRLAHMITGRKPQAISTREMCHEAIRHEHAPDSLEAQAIARCDRHLDRGKDAGWTLGYVLPWLRAEVKRGVVS